MASEGDPALLAGKKITRKGPDEGEQKAMDEENLRKIFRQFDSDGSGAIDVGELKDAMRMLGVKVSANSAQRILSKIDKDGNGTVEWEEFHEFFIKVRDPDEIKKLLSEANQQYLDYKGQVEGDPNFSKKFVMPEMGPCVQKFVAHNDNVEAVCWLADTGNFASCAIDGEIHVWNASDSSKRPKPIKSIDVGKGIYRMCSSKDGKKLLVGLGLKEQNLWLYDIESEKLERKFMGHTTPVYSCNISSDQNNCVSGGKNGKMLYHDMSRDMPMNEVAAHESCVYSVQLNRKGDTICSCSSDGTVKIWDARNLGAGKADFVIEDAAAMGVVFGALWQDDKHILSCGDDYCVKRWDLRNLQEGPVTNYFGHTSPIKSIALSNDGYFLVTACDDGSMRVWLTDERGMIEDFQGKAARKLQAKQKEVAKFAKLYEDGEGDPADLKKANAESKEIQEEVDYYDKVFKERCALGCVQARLGLEGHTLGIAQVAWRDVDKNTAQVISGAQDQSVRLFNVDKAKLQTF